MPSAQCTPPRPPARAGSPVPALICYSPDGPASAAGTCAAGPTGAAMIHWAWQKRPVSPAGAASSAASSGVLRILPLDATDPRHRDAHTFAGGRWVCPLFGSANTPGPGRHESVVLLDPSVSREHVRLERASDDWLGENISADHPVLVHGRGVPPRSDA